MSEVEREGRAKAGHAGPIARGDVLQVLSVVGGPLALLVGLQAKYALVQTWVCKSPVAGSLVVHGVALLTLLMAVGAGLLARRAWRGAGREDPEDLPGREGRTRTIAAVGLGLSALSALTIFGTWLPQLFISPCQP